MLELPKVRGFAPVGRTEEYLGLSKDDAFQFEKDVYFLMGLS